jgi:hypothetical protein
MNLKQVKLGKNLELKHIPFSELIIPYAKYADSTMQKSDSSPYNPHNVSSNGVASTEKLRASKNLKRDDLDILKHSIGRFGLLKPFQIAEIPESLVFFYGKGKYFIIDGCKRYLAIRELLKLPTEEEERVRRDSLRTHSGHHAIERAEIQAVENFNNLSIVDQVMIPCLIYPYKTYLQMLRHRIEAKKLGMKPSKNDLKLAEKMRQEGVLDLELEDLSQLWETNRNIEKEKRAVEKTLQQIRDRIHGSHVQQISPL